MANSQGSLGSDSSSGPPNRSSAGKADSRSGANSEGLITATSGASAASAAGAAKDAPKVANLALGRAEVTREAIRTAVTALLAEEHPAAISVPAVARRAGISVRTVYRYFPSKQALLDDIADTHLRKFGTLNAERDDIYRDPETWLPVLWTFFGQDVAAVRAQHASPAGADIRDRRLAHSRAKVLDALRDGGIEGPDEQLRTLVDAILAVASSGMFLELNQRLGYEPTEAAALAVWILRAVQQRFVNEGAIR